MPTQTTDGQIIPAVGSTVEYIQDPTAGWVYRVTTSVSVDQLGVDAFAQIVTDAQATAATAQALVDSLTPVVSDFQTKVAQIAQPMNVATSSQSTTP